MAEEGHGGFHTPSVPGQGDRQLKRKPLGVERQHPRASSLDYDGEATPAAPPRTPQDYKAHNCLSPPLPAPTRPSDGSNDPYHRPGPLNLSIEGVPLIPLSQDSATATQVEDIPPLYPPKVTPFAKFRAFTGRIWQRTASYRALSTPRTHSRVFAPIWKIWWPEALSILLGLCALILIIVVLNQFDKQSLPDWPFNITLNTFVAVISTFARAAFMFPVSVAISQAQWTWFRKERPLHDFHLIDQASRSPWGSIVLLWKVRVFHHPVALGALLTIFGVLTSPITQLVITYPVRSVVDPSVQVNALSIRSIRTPRDAIADGTRNALLLGPLTDATNFTLPQEPLSGASCSTGNCTFGSYHTLGVCMKTANITAHLAIAEFADNGERGGMPLDGDPTGTYLIPSAKVYTASLPGGFDLTHQGPMAALVDILNGGDTFGFSAEDEIDVDALGARIASFVNIYTIPLAANETGGEGNVPGQRERVLSSISSFRHEALEVLFYLCVQTYETSIVNGVEKNQLVGQLAKRIEDQAATTEIPFLDVNCTSLVHDQNTRCEPKPSRQQEVLHLQAPGKDGAREEKGSGISVREQEEFSADYHSMERMASAMKLYLASSASVAYDPELFPNARAFGYGASSFSLTLFSDVLYRLDSPTADNSLRQTRIMNIYLNIATSLSTMMRVGMPQRYTQDVVGVAGLAWREIPYVHVTWGLLTFLAAELVLTAILIAITAVRTYDSTVGTKPGDESRSLPPDLKDSSLPVLSALNPECRALMGEGIQPIEELKARSRKIRVRLEGGELVPVD